MSKDEAAPPRTIQIQEGRAPVAMTPVQQANQGGTVERGRTPVQMTQPVTKPASVPTPPAPPAKKD